MLIFGEARSEPLDAKIAVGCVVRNRVKLAIGEFGRTWINVILRPHAFDCFDPKDPNRALLLSPTKYEAEHVWDDCYLAAVRVYQQVIPDKSNGALFYFSPPLIAPPNCWGDVELSAQIGRLKFWRRIKTEIPLNQAA